MSHGGLPAPDSLLFSYLGHPLFREDGKEEEIASQTHSSGRFSELVKVCMENGPQMITRHGRDTVVVISAKDTGREVVNPWEERYS